MANPDPQYQAWGWEPAPNPTGRVPFILRGRRCLIDPLFVPLWTEIEAALDATGYENPCDWIGIHKYRVVAGTNQLSRHAYLPGIAIDFDYGGDTDGDGDPTIDRNPHLHRKVVDTDYGNTIQLLRHQVDAVLSIRTVSGERALRWLGDVNGDSMHFDVDCSRADIESGIVPYQRKDEEDSMAPFDVWIQYIRITDIQKMGADAIIAPAETAYFTQVGDGKMWEDHGSGPVVRDPNDPDWQNLYNAWRVRSPIWAV